MEDVLFITNKIFLDLSLPEGGVRLCTMDYIHLLQVKYKVNILKVGYNKSLLFRIKVKLGLDVYEEYNPSDFHNELEEFIIQKKIKKVFLNLANAMAFGKYIKENFGATGLKVILCSHGNESGDFLHQAVRFEDEMAFPKNLFSSLRLGKILKKESYFRLHYIDLVLTVSQVEEQIEKWLGAKYTYMVPRVFKPNFLDWKPVSGKIGFVGDIRHEPNYFGLYKLCEGFEKLGSPKEIDIRIVGKIDANSHKLKERFPFVTLLGYLDDEAIESEASTWCYYLNLVFYYSKGVSTKLEKGINWGIPIISTTPGNRGYILKGGSIITIDDPIEMAKNIVESLTNKERVYNDRKEIIKIVEQSIKYEEVMEDISELFNKISKN